jgi:hypothetical protein
VSGNRWLVLVHHLPAEPNYLRVKISRRLDAVGAVALKGSVYLLPLADDALEHCQWILREITAGGGVGYVFESRFVGGLSDAAVERLFQDDRQKRYAELANSIRETRAALRRDGKSQAGVEAALRRLRKQLDDIVVIDFFGARGRDVALALLAKLEGAMKSPASAAKSLQAARPPVGATWVTRTGIKVDRMASAWLIRRFIDPKARLKFVAQKTYSPAAGQLRFDMFDGEFTHEGELCTFEVLLQRFGLSDAALQAMAEIVHDIDLKDSLYGRPETSGVQAVIDGITLSDAPDDERLSRATVLFDGLYAQFSAGVSATKGPRANR